MPASALSSAELLALQLSDLPVVPHAPFIIQPVAGTIYSTCRHAGRATVQGYAYTYVSAFDELIREDVLRWLRKCRGEDRRRETALARTALRTLMGD